MNFLKLVKPSVDYDRRLVDSAVQGARTGEREFSKRRRLVPYLFESAGRAVGPAVIGACVGIVSSYLRNGAAARPEPLLVVCSERQSALVLAFFGRAGNSLRASHLGRAAYLKDLKSTRKKDLNRSPLLLHQRVG